jgi:hypothetical protein
MQGGRNVCGDMPAFGRKKWQANRRRPGAGQGGKLGVLINESGAHWQAPGRDAKSHPSRNIRRGSAFERPVGSQNYLVRAAFKRECHGQILHRRVTAERL